MAKYYKRNGSIIKVVPQNDDSVLISEIHTWSDNIGGKCVSRKSYSMTTEKSVKYIRDYYPTEATEQEYNTLFFYHTELLAILTKLV